VSLSDHEGAHDQAESQECKSDICVTVKPKPWWKRIGGWFGSISLGFVRWGRLDGPSHRAAVEALSKYWEAQGYKVKTEQKIDTPGGAKPYRFADVYGKKTNPDGTESTKIGQIGRTKADGQTPVTREQSALNDIQAAEPNASVEFYDYQAPFPSELGLPGWPVQPAIGINGIGAGDVEVPDIILPE
jgi:hypothetical protein